MNEPTLVRKIKKAVESHGAYAAKVHGGRYSVGVPDLLICYLGQFGAFEVKLPGKEKNLTELQAAQLSRVRAANGVAAVITSVDESMDQLAEMKTRARIAKKGHSTERGCKEWTGRRNDQGYGRTKYRGKNVLVHRLVAHLYWDFDLNSKLDVLHTCDNPPCYQLNHLFVGTAKENMIDCLKKGRRVTTLDLTDIPEIRDKRASGKLLKELSEEYGVSKGLISNICTGKKWGWVE